MITFGLSLPHYDGLFSAGSTTGAVRTQAAFDYALRAEQTGFSQVWVSDHLWLDLDGERRRSPDCWTLLAAIATRTQRIRLGSLVTAAPLREPALLAHQVATVADLASGRLDVGLGAGWHAPEFTENGIRFPSTHERLAAVERTVHAVRSTLRATTPPIWLGGKRSGILAVAGRVADGWNLAWDPTPATYLQRSELLERAAIEVGRDGSQISRSIGLTTLLGTDEEDLLLRWIKLRRWAPGAHLDKVRFDTWRQRGLIGAPDEIRHRISMWHDLGVTHIVCAFGIPFGMCDDEQLELFAATVLHDSDPPTM